MAPDSFDTIRWSFDDASGIGTIVLDRPDSLNALSAQLREEFVEGLQAFAERDGDARTGGEGVSVRAVVVEGAGDAFSAGADIDEFDEINPGVFEIGQAYEAAESFPAPVVAKIDGYCLGGGLELALSCDFRFASRRSTFGQPEIDLGIIPGGGGTQRLAAAVGTTRAKELCITGEQISAETAEHDGIVDYVYPAADLDDEVDAFTSDVASKPPLAVRAVKDVMTVYHEVGLRAGRRYERRTVDTLRKTEDAQEGARAFAEDREPEWQGR